MPSVNRENPTDSQWSSWEPAPAEPANTSKSAAATTPPPALGSWGEDSALESTFREQLGQLNSGDRLQVAAKAELKLGESVGFEAEATVDRQKDGTFTVELNAKGDVGPGASVIGSARGGLAAGTKLHFQTAAQAADFLDAFAKEGTLTASHLDNAAHSLRLMGVKGDVVDAQERLVGHLANISEMKGDLVGTVKLGDEKKLFGFKELEASADVQVKHGFKIDLEKGTFTQIDSVSIGGKSKLEIPRFLNMSANARGTMSTNATWKLSPEQLRDFKAGKLSPDAVASALSGLPDEVSIKCELELAEKAGKGGVIDTKEKLTIEYPCDLNKLWSLEPRTMLNELSRKKWKAEFDIGIGFSAKVDAKAGNVELSGSLRHKETLQGEYDLNAGIAALQQRTAEAGESMEFVDAQRATANLR